MVRLVIRNRRVRALTWKISGPSDEVTARAEKVDRSVAAAWAELDDVLCDYGMARAPSETPRALARRLTQQHEFDAEAAGAITAIASAVERLLFARDPGSITPLKRELRIVRRALAATASRGRRIRATLLPPSTLLRMRGMGESAGRLRPPGEHQALEQGSTKERLTLVSCGRSSDGAAARSGKDQRSS
ncbi:DUF4129 domain-containing protein [Nonomuraea recticatena]|uniref:DUF4129 domain-containing protein n=1 Tax=Nonomuraea recticatena TaxID=46178 RepID=UPI0036128E66